MTDVPGIVDIYYLSSWSSCLRGQFTVSPLAIPLRDLHVSVGQSLIVNLRVFVGNLMDLHRPFLLRDLRVFVGT